MKKLKSENGAIAILVLISLVFLTTFLISSYVIMSNKMQSQRKVISDTKDIYESYDLNQMYESYFDKSRDGLPDNVEQLEYIESTGTQYIDTGVFPSNNLKINIKACYTNSNSSYMLGSDNAYNAGIHIRLDSKYIGIFGGSIMNTGVVSQVNVPVTITLQNNKIYVDGQQKGSGTTQDVSKYSKSSIYVFCTHRGGEAKYNASMRLYELQMYDGDTLIRDFIPILDENDVAYLYDKVEKKFYYNSGTGTFNYKKKDSQNMQLTKVNYIESTGTQYIDTGVKPSNSTKVDIKFMYNSLNGFVYGSRTSSSGSDAHEFIINASGLVFPQFDGQHNEVSSSYNKIGEEYILSNSQSGAYINGNLIKSYNTATFSSKHSMFLFGLNQNGTVEYRKFIGRLYYCKIYNGDTLVRDFVPVIDGSNIACLYDKVEKKCYYNVGTGTFSYGE
jgi:hypothetical protein